MGLSFEEVLGAAGKRTQTVDMSAFGWPGSAVVRKMTVRERDAFAKSSTSADPEKELIATATLLSIGLAEPKVTVEQAQRLLDTDADAIEHLLKAVLEFNTLTKEAGVELKRQFPDGQRSEVPVHPGAEAAQNG